MSALLETNPSARREDGTVLRARELFDEHRDEVVKRTDRLFGGLMVVQWLAGILAALVISPRAWVGPMASVHPHVWAAVLLGGALIAYPVALTWLRPGRTLTRHAVAVGQMLTSALLIHITGGRIETHFHVFGSLAFLAFYRDWRVLVSASAVVAADHYLRGAFWPQSVYGILNASSWRWLEHAGWVVFEDVFLVVACLRGTEEMKETALRQATVETLHRNVEEKVLERTAALQESQERFRSLSASAPVGIFQTDRAGQGTYTNPGWQAIAGLSLDESLGDGWTRAIHPDDRVEVVESWAKAASGGEPFHREFRFKTPAGDVRWVDARATPMKGEQGDVIGYVGTVEDISERRQLEGQLRQSQKMEAVGRLAGGIAHDFNNLLTVMMGHTSLLLGDHGRTGEKPPRATLEQVLKAGERASSLTRQLLAFSRKQVLQPKVLDLSHVTRDMDKMLRRLIGEDVRFTTTSIEALGHVKADPGQIEQVLVNLVVNARDAMPDGGHLTLTTENADLSEEFEIGHPGVRAGRYVKLSVSDSGIGMDAETQSHIFEPFFTTKERGKGTGLGLATVYGIIKQSDGHISVYSEPGHGTTFTIYLPRVDEPVDEDPSNVQDAATPTGGETILLVEDEDDVRTLARTMLERFGYTVLEASSGPRALELERCFSGTIHMLLTDVIMPEMNGRDLCERFCRARPESRVLFMSGYTDDAIVRHGVLEAGTAFIQKPFLPADLAIKVRDSLDAPAPRVLSLSGA